MSYVVLARKWRPRCFEDLVGQSHVSRTLANAIDGDRVAHAFLFTGVRGVGKTTTARILAKALNCAEGPTPTPCQKCSSCREIPDGNDVDVQEIDGASYNGVDEVRRLQESLPYRPARDRFKIFIVDEVHMLSTAAWNAFLKTLEEPPPHVKFIFATTEVHKVPLTILSRCQRYDFKLILTQDIAAQLVQVLETENVPADDEAVRIIAREAAGSMRDAMSLLDQVLAWVAGSEDRLTGVAVGRVLGVAARSVLHRLGEALVAGKPDVCLQVVAELAEQGYSMVNVAKGFLGHLRDLVVAKVGSEPAGLLELADSELADVLALAKRSDADDLCRVYLGFSRAFDDVARSEQPRAALEMALVRLARRPPLAPLDDLLDRVARLERRLTATSGGEGGRGGRSPQAGGGGAAGRGPTRGSTARAQGRRPGAEDEATTRAPPASHSGEPERVASDRPAPAAAAAQPLTPPDARAMTAWRAILSDVATRWPAVASAFEHAAPLHIEPERIVLGFTQSSFVAERATDTAALELVTEAARVHFGCDTTLELDWTGRYEGVTTVAEISAGERAARIAAARKRVAERPLVKAAMEVFDAELREIRLPEDLH